ncbi:bifunctional DNA primase/polymerase [bacterium]|nr:bifunctional DNA primase/polymerase [bacterium]
MTGFAFDLASVREYYAEYGFDTLPLLPGTKRAGVKAWQSRSSLDLWQNVKVESNIGIRCGGQSKVAVIDCDDKEQPGTADKIFRFLSGLGLVQNSYPLVKTASGTGRHIYIKARNAPKDRHYFLIAGEVGAGEIRFGAGAYVAAPPSVVGDNSKYQLIAGDFRKLPEVDFKDLLPLLKWEEKFTKKRNRTISRYAYRLLMGDILAYFPSRSEAEQALICSLINTGHTYPSIENLFLKYPGPGKFKEKYSQNPKEGFGYLKHSYFTALEWTENNTSEGRQIAENAIDWAESRTWPGRTGTYDRDIFLAHARIAWKCGKVVYAASCRDLAELANITHVSATNGTKRLTKQGYIHLEKTAVASLANMYSLHKNLLILQNEPLEKRSSSFNHDVFCYQGLGKSSKLILEQLSSGPKTEVELIELTGKTKPTVKKWLGRMSKIVDIRTGEIVPLVYQENGEWFMVDNPDFDLIAEILSVAGTQAKRKRDHEREREIHAHSLRLGQE